jgi:hypothetical protein
MKNNGYDLIFSLGGCCHAAAQLTRRGLRPFSTPLDWIEFASAEPTIRYLPTGFRTRFADFCRKENLRAYKPSENNLESNWAPYCYYDVHTGFTFIHHFFKPVEDEAGYNEVMAKFRRRFDRLFSAVDSCSSVLFILHTWFAYDPELIDPLYDALREIWPGKKIAVRVMQFAASADAQEPERWGGGGLYRYKRRCNPYDFAETNWEWSFLDGYMDKRRKLKPRGLDRIAYKICKSLHKMLKRKGYDVDFRQKRS